MANLLTLLRLLLVVPVALSLANAEMLAASGLMFLLVLAIASDILDGKVARYTNTASARGQLFDHSTDFIFVTAGLSAAAFAGLVPVLLPLLIVFAFSQYVLDSRFLYRDKRLRMSFLGRWNGIFYFVPLVLIALSRFDFLVALNPLLIGLIISLAYTLIVTTMLSIIDRALAPFR